MKRVIVVVSLLSIFILGFVALFLNSQTQFVSVILPIKSIGVTLPVIPSVTPYIPPSLTLSSIFSGDHTWTANIPENNKRVLVAAGDIIPARSVNYQSMRRNDFTWAFKNIAPILTTGDITVVNLETTLLKNCPVTQSGMLFCGSEKHIEGLKLAGIDIVSFSNNHIGNHGIAGITETKKLLDANNIGVTGISGPLIKDVKGMKFLFLAYNEIGTKEPMVSWLDEETMVREISQARKASDVVVVMMSWGVEYTDKPTNKQRQIAKHAIDAGADLILGNHPHWIQGVEFYKGKLIVYAQGNTIFDQMWSEKTKEGVIGKYTFYDKTLVDVEFIPTYIKDFGQPVLLEGTAKTKILENMKKVSY